MWNDALEANVTSQAIMGILRILCRSSDFCFLILVYDLPHTELMQCNFFVQPLFLCRS